MTPGVPKSGQNDVSGGPTTSTQTTWLYADFFRICVHREPSVDNSRSSLGAGLRTAPIHSEGCRDGAVIHMIGRFSSARSTGPQVYGRAVPPSIQTLRRPTSASIGALLL